MKDFLGRELKIKDWVVVAPKGYRGLVKAQIRDFTPQKVHLVYVNYLGREINYLAPRDFVVKI